MALEKELRRLRESGVTSLACCLMHSYLNSEHEQLVGSLAAKLGFSHVSLSSQVTFGTSKDCILTVFTLPLGCR